MWRFNMDRFSAMVEVWLHFHQLSVKELAELASVSTNTVYNVKKGDNVPDMASFVAICNAISMPPETFFKKEGKH